MKYKSHLITAASIAAIACCGSLTAFAQGQPSPTPSPKAKASPSPTAAKTESTTATAAKPARAIPFRGTASAVDQTAKTFTIAGKSSSRVFKVTDRTVITKAGEAATFADLPDNEPVTGSYWKHEDGTLEAKSLKIGGKTDAEKAKSSTKKSKKSDGAEGSTEE